MRVITTKRFCYSRMPSIAWSLWIRLTPSNPSAALHGQRSTWVFMIWPLISIERCSTRGCACAIITLLREAFKAGVLKSNLHPTTLEALLAREYRWCSVHVDYFQSKEHFLRYAGRYAHRPPIAQHRFEEITDETVRFSLKDKRLKIRVSTRDFTQ